MKDCYGGTETSRDFTNNTKCPPFFDTHSVHKETWKTCDAVGMEYERRLSLIISHDYLFFV